MESMADPARAHSSTECRLIGIRADETAGWRCGGLRQIDRLLLALNEAVSRNEELPCAVQICWSGIAPIAFDARRVHHLQIESVAELPSPSEDVAILTTHLVPPRRVTVQQLRERTPGFLLETKSDLAAAEKFLLAQTGKRQDGFVSRLLNRPISRVVTRVLVRLPISPNQWTIGLMIVPLLGALFLMWGDYAGFVLGALLFQLHSALDGCDGEMARLLYAESPRGRWLDGICDRLTTLLYAVSLGLGLSSYPHGWLYLSEGIAAALLIGVAETWLTRAPLQLADDEAQFNQGDQMKVWMMKETGLASAGGKLAALFSQITKRDFFNFGFLLLALLGWPQGILHILAICGIAIAVVAVKSAIASK